MPSSLEQAGAVKAPSNYAPLHTNRFFTGLWSHRNPLRDAATPFLYEKFYSGSRFDSLIDGLNVEVTSRLTLARRAGHAIYNAQLFPKVNRFHGFRIFSSASEIIKVMADCAADVYDATSPNKVSIFTKSAGAGSTNFQGVGNILYMGNGADEKKWLQSSKQWIPFHQFVAGDFIVDQHGILELFVGAVSVQVQSFSITGNIVTFTTRKPLPLTMVKNVQVVISGLTTGVYLNGLTSAILAVPTYNQFTMTFVHANVALTTEAAALASATNGTTGEFQPGIGAPDWNGAWGGVTIEVPTGAQWINRGPAVQNWGIAAPAVAPTVALAKAPGAYPAWQANTFYSPSLIISDGVNLQKLTTGGITGGGAPVWNVVLGGTTADGTAIWTNIGPIGWLAGHAYAAGDTVAVTYTYFVTVIKHVRERSDATGTPLIRDGSTDTVTFSIAVSDFFTCTTAGVSAAAQPNWQNGTGAKVSDNTVVWTNGGAQKVWADVGAATNVSLDTAIIGANGYVENVITAGKTGGAEPAWGTATGEVKADGTATWSNGGQYSAANTGDWIYSFAFKNSLSNEISTDSPLSNSIRLASGTIGNLQGSGSSDLQVDTIQIYRTAQGGSIQLLLDEIPNPAAGVLWTYSDANTDAALNIEIQAQRNHSADRPPSGLKAMAYHALRMWGALNNAVYFSSGPDILNGNGQSAWPPANVFVFPSKVTRLWATSIGLIVFTVSDIYIILGRTAASFYSVPFIEGIGLLSYDAFCVNGSTAYLMSNAKKLISIDPSAGVSEPGFPIGDLLATYDPSLAQLAWHEEGSGETALYVADGATGWYRMSPTAPPESGFSWSPKAVIGGGCATVASIEVSPGVKRLLVSGTAGTNPILYRNSTTHLDNAATYAANVTIGSIVMAQAGFVAEIDFMTMDSMRVGTRPTLATLMGEISGGFDDLFQNTSDPPSLPESETLYNDRYYMSQTQQPGYCRHFQLRLTWAAENAANELLSYAIYGAIHQEQG